jgi:hypothetical protein
VNIDGTVKEDAAGMGSVPSDSNEVCDVAEISFENTGLWPYRREEYGNTHEPKTAQIIPNDPRLAPI